VLSADDANVLFIGGTSKNQVKFYPQFDHIVLLSAPAHVLVERLTTRTNNPYGKKSDEVAEQPRLWQTIEPLLRGPATLEIDTSTPLERVITAISITCCRNADRSVSPCLTGSIPRWAHLIR